MTKDLDTMDLNQFLVNYHIGKETPEELKRVYELFLDPDSDVITYDSFTRVANALGVELDDPENMWKRCVRGGVMDFDGFYDLMTKEFIGGYRKKAE